MVQKALLSIAVVLGSFLLPKQGYSQLKSYRFEEMGHLQKEDGRYLVVFIHADWCVYCQTMINTTFKDQKVINLLNNDFYFIQLDAEDKEDIHFAGHSFHYKPSGANTGINELAEVLSKNEEGQLSYPVIVFLNPENEITFQYEGFLNGKDLRLLLVRIKAWKEKK